MKRIIQLTLTVTLLSFLTVSTTYAQNFLGNRTACDMEMSVVWGDNMCNINGSFNTIVPAFSVVPIPMPATDVIVAAKGYYLGTSCLFYVGIPCTPYSMTDFVVCSQPCGDYKARLDSWGVVVYQ